LTGPYPNFSDNVLLPQGNYAARVSRDGDKYLVWNFFFKGLTTKGQHLMAPTAASYWAGNAKAVRDAAEVGTPLLGALTTLAWWPKLLIPLIFLGVASFMLGIAMEFAAIPGILDRRIELLTQAVPLMGRQ
jgi:hypothetical protein